jgi:hypothetical protein
MDGGQPAELMPAVATSASEQIRRSTAGNFFGLAIVIGGTIATLCWTAFLVWIVGLIAGIW